MNNEWFDLITEEGTVIGRALREVCHTNPGLLHQAVHVWVFHPDGSLFLQKRAATKDLQPGKWDTSVGGHLAVGESNEQGARREMSEELGITDAILTPTARYVWRNDQESEVITAFGTIYDGPIHTNPGEIDDGRFWPLDEIRAHLGHGIFTPQFEHEFPLMAAWSEPHAGVAS